MGETRLLLYTIPLWKIPAFMKLNIFHFFWSSVFILIHCDNNICICVTFGQANGILLPLESVLSKDVATMTEAMGTERDSKTEVSPIHGQAIYQSYSLRVTETYQNFKSLVPSLISSVKGLHALFIRLAQTASVHAGNLNRVRSLLYLIIWIE